MTSYTFYQGVYLGESIPFESWALFAQRAGEDLERLSCALTLTPQAENAQDMAVCAMADALYYFDQAANQRQTSAVTIGAVSAQTTAPAVDITPKAQQAELLRCVRRYFTVERWCRC